MKFLGESQPFSTALLLVHPHDLIRESFEKQPACTVAEVGERIFQLTGLRRSPSQVRKFAKDMGLKFRRVRAIPVPPKKTWPSTSRPRPLSSRPS